MRLSIPAAAVILLLTAHALPAAEKLTDLEKVGIIRGLSYEYATAKVQLPRAKKPLPLSAQGVYDRQKWDGQMQEYGPAARVGDLVQVTKVTIGDTRLLLEINRGFKGGRKWYQNVQVGMGGVMNPIAQGTAAPGGTSVVVEFPDGVPANVTAIKKGIGGVLDFDKHSATQNYIDTLPEPIKKAIARKQAIEGMDRDQVLMALGRPRHKIRETKDGDESEDWIYGEPPGKITFVTFNGSKVVRVREDYAGLGGETAPPLPTP
ncbi:MAG: hypothetical protein IT160_06065 [Bryobacterales bacterium]|nr:hypothetical protein [Bryobacterales bacterium]